MIDQVLGKEKTAALGAIYFHTLAPPTALSALPSLKVIDFSYLR
jgi:hypothetical protein